MIFLENERKLENNLIRLWLSSNNNYTSITKGMRSLLKYFNYLWDKYWSSRYQEIQLRVKQST